MPTIKLNSEEKVVIRITIVVLVCGVIFKLLHIGWPEWKWLDVLGALGLGLGAGSTASVITSGIVRTIKEDKIRKHFGYFSGAWKRESLYQYSYLTVNSRLQKVEKVPKHRIREADGRSITIEYVAGRTLHLYVDYDQGRGTVRGQVEFSSDNGIVGEGTYIYVHGPLSNPADNEGVPHSGKYTVHLFPDVKSDTIHIYYDGLMPEPDAKGYEVWRRDPQGPNHLSWR